MLSQSKIWKAIYRKSTEPNTYWGN